MESKQGEYATDHFAGFEDERLLEDELNNSEEDGKGINSLEPRLMENFKDIEKCPDRAKLGASLFCKELHSPDHVEPEEELPQSI